jgi:hypothetical protein
MGEYPIQKISTQPRCAERPCSVGLGHESLSFGEAKPENERPDQQPCASQRDAHRETEVRNKMNTTKTLFRLARSDKESRSVRRNHIVAAALLSSIAALATGAAIADEGIVPMDGVSLDLGSFHGSAYYSMEPDGDHLSVTLASMDGDEMPGEPLRFATVLPVGGSVTISTPQAEGQQAIEMTFDRVGDHVAWHEGARAVNNDAARDETRNLETETEEVDNIMLTNTVLITPTESK